MQEVIESTTNDRAVKRMRTAREAVMWLGMAWLVALVALAAVALLGDFESASAATEWGPAGRPPLIEEVSDTGRPLGQTLNHERWTDGLTSRAPRLGQLLAGLALATVLLVVWLAVAVFRFAQSFGGTVYGLGHATLVLLFTPILFFGPAWIPLLVEDDIRRGHARRVRGLRNPTLGDLVAIALVGVLVLLAMTWA